MPFNIADKIQLQLLAQPECLQGQLIPLAIFGADAKDAYSWMFATKNRSRINAAHYCILCQMNRFALDIGPRIQQYEMVVRRRDDSCNPAPIDPSDPAEF